ncbi:MAG: MarR family winged helix-turn-helix transcriptional regulator [Gemmatimonadales bacterium]
MTRTPVRPSVTPRQAALVELLKAAGRVEQGLAEICERHGLTHDQYNVLRILRGAHPEGHPRYAIGERLINRAPDVTRLLGRLEQQGLVERYRPDADQRLSMARATAAGLRLLERVDPEIQALHERLAARLRETEARRLSEFCRRVGGEAAGAA